MLPIDLSKSDSSSSATPAFKMSLLHGPLNKRKFAKFAIDVVLMRVDWELKAHATFNDQLVVLPVLFLHKNLTTILVSSFTNNFTQPFWNRHKFRSTKSTHIRLFIKRFSTGFAFCSKLARLFDLRIFRLTFDCKRG